MKKTTKRALSILLALLMMVSLATACTPSSGPDPSGAPTETNGQVTPTDTQAVDPGEVKTDKDTFVYALNAEPKTLDGLLADDFVAYTITNSLYDNLIIQEPSGELTPGLAEKWEFNAEGDEITFYLRKGVKFHDGGDFTAEDVKYTFDHDIGHAPASNLTSAMDRMEIIDDYTVKLFLKHPFGPIEYCIAGSQMAIVSKNAREADPEGFARNPVGTGPYKVTQWLSGDKIIIERFDDYWQGAADIREATFKIITDTGTAILALETGEVDMAQPTPGDRDNLMANPDITYYEVAQQSTYFLAMNNKRGLFADKDMRLAMAYGIDRQELLDGLLDGVGMLCSTPMPPGIFGFIEDFEWYEYNPEKAKAHLAAAGYPDGLTITFLTMAGGLYTPGTEIIQDQLRKIGVTVEIEKMERAAFLDKLHTNKNYEISLMSATAFYPDADYIHSLYYSDPTEKGRNYHVVEDPVLDDMLARARVSLDSNERIDLYRSICERFKEEAYQVPLLVAMNNLASDAKLRGFEISPLRRIYLKYMYWVD